MYARRSAECNAHTYIPTNKHPQDQRDISRFVTRVARIRPEGGFLTMARPDYPTDGSQNRRKAPRTAEEWEAYVLDVRDRVLASEGRTAEPAPDTDDDDPWGFYK